jgi:23S rRNA pseudouridine2605 synthase
MERYSDSRNRDDKKFGDKKPYKSRDIKRDDNERPVEKYVDQRKRNDNYRDDDRKFSDDGKSKRPRIVETKTYEGRVREYRETEILIKDNTYEKRRSFTQKSSKEGIRLNKYIANAGICSRREADILIEAGAISINGKIITKLGTKVMPSDQVKYGDQLLAGEQLQYLLLNKPKGYLTTTDDPQERKTVMMIVESACKERIYPVGRLDKNTSGLLLFTNDGELAKKLTHPKYQVEKIYHAELDKALTMSDMKKIAEGIELDDGFIKIDAIAYGETKKEVGIELHSGKNRIVRRVFESLGYDVVKLDRVVFAGLTKKELPRGKYRFLSFEEINILRRIR